jgi:hypothetical protein
MATGLPAVALGCSILNTGDGMQAIQRTEFKPAHAIVVSLTPFNVTATISSIFLLHDLATKFTRRGDSGESNLRE